MSMLNTIALMMALGLAPGQTGAFQLTNVRSTYGEFGPERRGNQLLPGDRLNIRFEMDNINVNDAGRVSYTMGMELTDSKKKLIYKQDPQPFTSYATLGGNRVPAGIFFDLPVTQDPGEYTVKVTVTDQVAKKKASFEKKFVVDRPTFGLVRLQTSFDPNGQFPSPPAAVTGQPMFITLTAVGFETRNPKKETKGTVEADVAVEMRVLDETGKPTLKKPLVGLIKELPEKVVAVPMQFSLGMLNRAGKYTVEFAATDHVSKKKAKLSFPMVVQEPK